MIAGPPAAPARRPYPLPGFSGRDDLLGWSLLPSARPGPRASAVRAAPLLPGPGSGVRRSRQATQLRTSGSKHSAWTHCVGAGPSLPLRLLAARPMLPGPHTQLGLRPASAPEEETWGRGGAPPTAPRPAARWVGPLSAGAPGPAPRPLSICGSSIQPLNHPAGASPAGPCWALGRGCGSGQACSWQQRMGPPGQGTDVWGPSLSCPQGQPKGPGDPRQRSPPLGAILPSQAVLVQVIKHLSAALYPPPRDGGAGGGGDRTGETPRSRSSPQRVRKALWRR